MFIIDYVYSIFFCFFCFFLVLLVVTFFSRMLSLLAVASGVFFSIFIFWICLFDNFNLKNFIIFFIHVKEFLYFWHWVSGYEFHYYLFFSCMSDATCAIKILRAINNLPNITFLSYFHVDFIGNVTAGLNFSFSLYLASINKCFVLLTTSIGLCAVVYSYYYMHNEPNAEKFIILIGWFVFSMSFLLLADNCFLLLLGWELIGLTSFFLINFYTTRRGVLKAAVKAFAFNKVSDAFLISFLLIIASFLGTTSCTLWAETFNSTLFVKTNSLTLAAVFLVSAASIKSAQLVGHLWLPDSMEAPVPASALIHSATLVSAGVYLLLIFYKLVVLCELTGFIATIGSLTAAYGGVVSAAQTDCKKLLAYSTISHCGFLFVLVSFGLQSSVLFYLVCHGVYKALTFFCVGNLILHVKGYQDLRRMGGLAWSMPLESIILVISAFNLGALPATLGFLYKHTLQGVIAHTYYFYLITSLCVIGALCSLVYAYKLCYYSLFDYPKTPNRSSRNQSNTRFKLSGVNFLEMTIYLLLVLIVYCFSTYWLQILLIVESRSAPYTAQAVETILAGTPSVDKTQQTFFIYFFSLFTGLLLALYAFNGRNTMFFGITNRRLVFAGAFLFFFWLVSLNFFLT